MKRIIGLGIKEMIEVVQKKKVIRRKNGNQYLAN